MATDNKIPSPETDPAPAFAPVDGFNFPLDPDFAFDESRISPDPTDSETINLIEWANQIPGFTIIGYYDGKYPVGSLDYFKNGTLSHRIVLVIAKSHGVHPDHVGQEPADYITGVQINNSTPVFPSTDADIAPKIPAEDIKGQSRNFSIDCIFDPAQDTQSIVDAGTGSRATWKRIAL